VTKLLTVVEEVHTFLMGCLLLSVLPITVLSASGTVFLQFQLWIKIVGSIIHSFRN
jgi:hypothetical protein